jgi:hypothetical protein
VGRQRIRSGGPGVDAAGTSSPSMAWRSTAAMGEVDYRGGAGGNGRVGLGSSNHQAGGVAMTEALDRWLQRWMWLPNVMILLALVIVATYAADRATPFRVLSVEPVAAYRGQTVVFRAAVWRDPGRHCSAEFSRFIFDSAGARHDLGNSTVTAAMIAEMERRSPGQLVLSVQIPDAIAPGPARLVTALAYRCNKVHSLWPIETTTELPFTVLP